jgi:hypothetical protein
MRTLTEVALDPGRRDALRDDTETLLGDPSDQNLCGVFVALRCNVSDLGRVDDSWFPGDVVAQGRVGGEMDSLLLAIGCAERHNQWTCRIARVISPARTYPQARLAASPGELRSD